MTSSHSTSDSGVCDKDFPAQLLEANANWARRLNQTFPRYFSDIKDEHPPKLIWIGCSDPRVQESDALAVLPGTVLVHRNIANQVHPNDNSVLSVLAYALNKLEVQHIAIVGHYKCGGPVYALKQALVEGADQTKGHSDLRSFPHNVISNGDDDAQSANTPENLIGRWLDPLVQRLKERDLRGSPEDVLRAASEENVKLQVDNFTKSELHAFIKRVAKKPVWVHGWMYDFNSGFIRDLDITEMIGAD